MQKNILPVSIIIPSYNSAKFIAECISSINSGRWIPSQIIVIDDCSTDDSFNIVKNLLPIHPNLELHQTKVNSGAAFARLIGFRNATQEFVGSVDADDFLDIDAIYDAYNQINQINADLCIWQLWRIDSTGKKWLVEKVNPKTFPLVGHDAVLMTLGDWAIHALGIARKSLYLKAYQELEDSGFQITESYNSDELIGRLFLRSVNKIVSSNLRYFYRVNPESTSLKVTKKHLYRLRSEMWLVNFSLSVKNSPRELLFKSLIHCAWNIFKNKNFFGSEAAGHELKKFLHFLTSQQDSFQFLYDNPDFFRAYFTIYHEYSGRK